MLIVDVEDMMYAFIQSNVPLHMERDKRVRLLSK